MPDNRAALAAIRKKAIRLDGAMQDYDALLEQAEGREFVLLGEASHGTLEFYRMRAEITRRLIAEKGFDAVAVEADWPDAWRLNRFVKGVSDDNSATAFDDFERFPQWMWRNREVVPFIDWLRNFNANRKLPDKIGFYGLDLYSLHRSAEAVITYLQTVDPKQADIASQRYACLDHGQDPQRYGYETSFGLRPACDEAVQRQLVELKEHADAYICQDGKLAADEQFFAERNAEVVRSAEMYYRAMFGSTINTWNLRDRHMAETLFALQEHLRGSGRAGRIVVWAHNSHLGDARHTDMGRRREWNLGQLVRQFAGPELALLVGFTTYTGYVSAADDWGGHVQRMAVNPARNDSYERLFQQTGLERFYLPLESDTSEILKGPLLERAIGVIYRPQTEMVSHYFSASLRQQFDAVFHLDETEAVQPLYAAHHWEGGEIHEAPDTYPFGL